LLDYLGEFDSMEFYYTGRISGSMFLGFDVECNWLEVDTSLLSER